MQTSLTWSDMARKSIIWKENNDCTVKAIAIALDIPYAKAWHVTRKAGREFRKGMNMAQIHRAFHLLDKEIVRLTFQGDSVQFMEQHPKGAFIFEIEGHIMTYKDGVLHDDTRTWYDKELYNIWHVMDPMVFKDNG